MAEQELQGGGQGIRSSSVVSYRRGRVLTWLGVFTFASLTVMGSVLAGSLGGLLVLPLTVAPVAYLLRRLRTLGPALIFEGSGFTDLRSGVPILVGWDEVIDVRVEWWGRAPWPEVVRVGLEREVLRPTVRDLVFGRPPMRTAASLQLWGTLVDASPREIAHLLDTGRGVRTTGQP